MSPMAGQRRDPRSYSYRDFPLERLVQAAPASVSICLPARNEAPTIGRILDALMPLKRRGLISQIVVVDDSTDGTAAIARARGADVYDQERLLPELGPVLGKGDAMWRALTVLQGDLVCFLDADSEQFGPHFVRGLIGPLLCDPQVSFVKGFYRRPFRVGDTVVPDGGGRVTELTARPLLRQFFPVLAGIHQPLAGEVAGRRELLERLPFVTGYGVDIALLLDAHAAVGSEGLVQVDLDVRQNRHQPLRALGPMADAVLQVVLTRLAREGRLPEDEVPVAHAVERPALASLRAPA
jgi:glucosyl-3-phosphoglycerate synthase